MRQQNSFAQQQTQQQKAFHHDDPKITEPKKSRDFILSLVTKNENLVIKHLAD